MSEGFIKTFSILLNAVLNAFLLMQCVFANFQVSFMYTFFFYPCPRNLKVYCKKVNIYWLCEKDWYQLNKIELLQHHFQNTAILPYIKYVEKLVLRDNSVSEKLEMKYETWCVRKKKKKNQGKYRLWVSYLIFIPVKL